MGTELALDPIVVLAFTPFKIARPLCCWAESSRTQESLMSAAYGQLEDPVQPPVLGPKRKRGLP